MDEVSTKIIKAFETQGYLKTATLATQLGIGERTVRRRVHVLINNGLVKVITLTNPILLGYNYWARVGVKTKIGFLHDVTIHLTKHPSICFLSESVGRFDLISGAAFKSIDQLAYFANLELPKIQGIQSAEVFPLVWPRKYFHFYWPLPVDMAGNPKNFDELNEQHHYELGEVDRRILDIVTKEGHISPAGLKSRLNISEATVCKHIKKCQIAACSNLRSRSILSTQSMNSRQQWELRCTKLLLKG